MAVARQKRHLGGFVALNNGIISDCYSWVDLHQAEHGVSGGFCGENRGKLERCAAQGRVWGKRKRSGFCGQQSGRCSGGVWLRPEQAAEEQWQDWAQGVPEGALTPERLEGWDLERVWHLESAPGEGPRLRLYDRREVREDYGRVVEIGSRQALLEAARQINSGAAEPDTCYRLTVDIDLGGRGWQPMGADGNTPFRGCFDGGGHEIRNLLIHSGQHPFAGLFGHVAGDGVVCNLRLDCQLVGRGSTAAPLCAVNDGEIINCTVRFHAEPSRYTGGLVGQNNGVIQRTSTWGKLRRRAAPPWWLAALLLLLLSLPAPIYFALTAQAAGQEIFAPVILDPNAVPIEAEFTPAPAEEEDSSAAFIMNAEMYVSRENYAGAIGLRCPSWSTRGFVATVRLTPEDQARAGWSGDGSYVPLYQSGLIVPGYGVDVITLGALPDGRRLPAGDYELSVLLEFYDVVTNEKSAVNTVVPLEVTVG